MPKRSEASYILHDIVPLFVKYGYPGAGDPERVKVNDVPIYRPSGGRSGATMDIVYYHNGEPLLLVEAKSSHKSHDAALKEAQNYIKNFPEDDKHYAPSGRSPRYIATTVGRDIKFYHHHFEVSKDGKLKQIAEPINILTFDDLLDRYGLIKGYKAKVLTTESFTKEFLSELTASYITSQERRITPEIIRDISQHILNYLENQNTYDTRSPFVELNAQLFSQELIKDLHRRFDLISSLTPEIAKQYRIFILRAFQGTKLNQYLTEQCVIEFMFDMIGRIDKNWKVLDFECGSGGFLAEVAKNGIPMENMLGTDIDSLPVTIAKTYLALYFGKKGKEIERIPVKKANGLLYLGTDWDLVIGNPAGSSKYKRDDIDEVLENLESDLNQDGKNDIFSEYNFSIQQAIRSCKVGGNICLVLPEGFFSNSQDAFLRKYLSKHCKILAIVSLPRGVFKKGTSTTLTTKGTQTATMKMSILLAEKTKAVIDGEGIDIDNNKLQYPIFLADVSEPESTAGTICEWLEPRLKMVLEEWKNWQHNGQITKLL